MARLEHPAGPFQGLAQELGVGLLHPEGVLAADRGESAGEAERIEHAHGEPLELVGADREPIAVGGEHVERLLDTRKGAGAVGDMEAVMGDEIAEHAVEIGLGARLALARKAALDHVAGAAADQHPALLIGDRRKAPPAPARH